MRLLFSLFIILFFLFSIQCSKSPLKRNKEIDSEFRNIASELKAYSKTHNNGKRKTRDPDIIKGFFNAANELIDFADEHSGEYAENLKKINPDKKVKTHQVKPNKYLNSKKTSFQYSRRNLKNQLKMVLKKVNSNKKFQYAFSLGPSRIFKIRPHGKGSSGSKKYESIRKKFN